jgi:peptidoglycan/LPS O-acetylase OafA/YrhL
LLAAGLRDKDSPMGTVRFLLALCVITGHSPSGHLFGQELLTGITAIQCFYVISGFLITMVLNERKEYQSLRNFYLSRYFRLWPVYIVVAAISLIAVNQQTMLGLLPKVANWPSIAFIALSNLTLFFQDWFLFVRFDNGALVPTSAFSVWQPPHAYQFLLVPQCWTLGIELTFYAISPFVCRTWRGVAALFAFGLASRVITASFHPALDPWIYRFAPNEMMLFGAGGLAYFAGRKWCPQHPLATKIMCALAMAAIVAVVFGFPLFNRFADAILDRLLIVNSPALILMVVAAAPLFYGTRNSLFDRIAGELSYPMYVSHILVFELMARVIPLTNNFLCISIVIAASLLLFLGIIVPTDKLRKRLGAADLMPRPSPRGIAAEQAT